MSIFRTNTSRSRNKVEERLIQHILFLRRHTVKCGGGRRIVRKPIH